MSPRSDNADDDDLSAALRPYQLAAAASPGWRTVDLIGNFGDLDSLFDQLCRPVMIELGTPLPKRKYLPQRIGACPAAHNRTLLGDRRRGPA